MRRIVTQETSDAIQELITDDSHLKHHFLLINGKLKLGGYKKVENILIKV